jgi:PPE-repeat protein
MLDFGTLPPEITSAQIYSGPGSEPLMVAAGAWDLLAAQLESFARGYAAEIAALEGQAWTGSAATAMAAAASRYAQWATTTGVQAEQAASQARVAAGAFETAHAAVVPPAAVAANRTQLLQLIATNILGQNANRIAAVEADYAEMWAQDTHAMFGYASSASSATRLSPFTAPPQTTNPAGASAAPAAAASSAAGSASSQLHTLSQLLSAVPQQLSAAAASSGTSAPPGIPVPLSLLTLSNDINYVNQPIDTYVFIQARNVGAVGSAILNSIGYFSDGTIVATPTGLADATTPLAAGLAQSTAGPGVDKAVLASVGAAAPRGRLSVPPAWTQVTPGAAATEQWLSSGASKSWEVAPVAHYAGTGPAAGMGPMVGVAGAAAARKLTRPSVSAILQVTPPRYKMPRPSSGG